MFVHHVRLLFPKRTKTFNLWNTPFSCPILGVCIQFTDYEARAFGVCFQEAVELVHSHWVARVHLAVPHSFACTLSHTELVIKLCYMVESLVRLGE